MISKENLEALEKEYTNLAMRAEPDSIEKETYEAIVSMVRSELIIAFDDFDLNDQVVVWISTLDNIHKEDDPSNAKKKKEILNTLKEKLNSLNR